MHGIAKVTSMSIRGKGKNRTLSVLTAIFPGGPWLAGTRMSPFWMLLELRMMEVVVTTGANHCGDGIIIIIISGFGI